MEYVNDKWIAVDDDGYIYSDKEKVYIQKKDFEGIAFCGNRYYIVLERSKHILILNHDFTPAGKILFKIGDKNNGAEGIACAKKGLYIVGQESKNVYQIDYNGNLLDSFELTRGDLSGADYHKDLLYVLSDADDVVMVIKDKKIIQEIAVGKTGEWEGIKVVDGIIYIIEDDEKR